MLTAKLWPELGDVLDDEESLKEVDTADMQSWIKQAAGVPGWS